MLTLDFAGWIQVRLATDPDPSDEPRGVSGWTFALAGEPDLDRIIRTRQPVALRSHAPEVGVTVRAVSAAGAAVADHPLLGARVDLLDNPKFEGRNGVIADDTQEFIHPFHLRVKRRGLTIERHDILAADARGDELPVYQIPPAAFRRHQPIHREGSPEVLAAIGVQDPAQFWAHKRELVAQELAAAQQRNDPIAISALSKRHDELGIGGFLRQGLLDFRMVYQFEMLGPATITAEHDLLTSAIDVDAPWPIAFWVGAWDTDALCAYLQGSLTLPTVERA
jgi:hypothetical protein